MAGRPKREEDVTPVLLRIPLALLKRVQRCQALLQLQTGTSVNRTAAFWRILEAGCAALESTQIPAPAQMSISKISEISGEDVSVPGYGFPEDGPLAQPVAVPQSTETSSAAAATRVETPTPGGRPGIPQAKLEEITDEFALCEGLSMREFAQRLYDKDIYRAKARDGRTVPVDHSRLRRWLEQARTQGLL